MKRLLLESLMAGAFVFLLVRAPLDLMVLDGPAPAAAGMAAASLSWRAAAGAALLTLLAGLVIRGARDADRRHAEAAARLESRLAPVWREAPRPAGQPETWRPRANAYADAIRRRYAPIRAARPRKLVDARPRRAPKTGGRKAR